MYLCGKLDEQLMEETKKVDGVRLIQLPLCVDERGCLSFMEEMVHIPFAVKRVFWIYGVPADKTRGGHAHWSCHEVVFPVAGSFDMEVDEGNGKRTFHMDDPSCGILIPAGVWCELKNFAPNTVCVVAASMEYDAKGYVNEHEAWRNRLRIKD